MLVTMTPRQPSVDVRLIKFELNRKTQDNSFFQQLQKEVMQSPKKAKKLIAQISSTSTMFCSGLVLVSTLAAAPSGVALDPDLRDTILLLIGLVAALSVVAALVAWMAAGVWKMYFGGSSADNWTLNILKGTIQVFTAPVVIALLIGLFNLLFGNLPAFSIIKDAVSVWFQG